MRQDKRAAPKAPINENISAREVRLIGADGEQVGIVSIDEALRIAEEAKLDLVEISADAVPPVCRVMDYGKSIFEKKKQVAAAKKNQKDSKGREGLARRASGLLSKPVTAVTTGALERALVDARLAGARRRKG